MSCRSLAALALGSLLGCTPGRTPAPPDVPVTAGSVPVVRAPSEPAAAVCSTMPGAPPSTELIARVEVRGLVRTPKADFCRYLRTLAGQPIDERRIQGDASALWDSGLFDDVSVAERRTAAETAIVFLLRERPLVHRFTAHGAQTAYQEQIAEAFPQQGQIFDPQTMRQAVETLREEYESDGYRRADIQLRVHDAPHNEVDVDVTIVEGQPALIESITLRGVSHGREAEVRALIDTGQGSYNAAGKPYRPDVLERDRYRITGYYLDRGMVQASVEEAEVALSADGMSATLTLQVTEGPIHKLRRIRCVGDLAGTEKKCLELLAARKGAVFSRSEVQQGLDRIREFQDAKKRGNVVEPEISLDEPSHSVDLTISIAKAP